MISEEIILDRDRVECITKNLLEMLKVQSHYQFKLRFTNKQNGERTLTIIPHATPVDIVI